MRKKDLRENDQIPRLLRLAFKHAEDGDEEKARAYWADAIGRGYVVVPKTAKWFERVIAKGVRDRGLSPAAPNKSPSEHDSGVD